MHYWRAYFHYYLNQLPIGLALFAIVWSFAKISWAVIIFLSISSVMGYLGYRSFYKKKLPFYYNLGITDRNLIMASTILNFIAILAFGAIAGLLSLV